MSITLRRGVRYTFEVMMDIPSIASAQSDGLTVDSLRTAFEQSGNAIGTTFQPSAIRFTRNAAPALDVVSMRVNYVGNVDRSAGGISSELDPWILETANRSRGIANRFVPHGNEVLRFFSFGLAGSSFVVDTSTVREGSSNAPPNTSGSVVSRLAQAATGGQIVDSSNRAEVGQGPSVLPEGFGLPWWATTLLVVGGIVVAGVAVGYTIRSFK